MHEVLAQLMEDMLYPQPTESDRHKGGTQSGRNHGQMNPGALSIMQFHLVWSLGHNSPVSGPLRDVACWHEPDLQRCPQFGRYRGESGRRTDSPIWSRMTHSRHAQHSISFSSSRLLAVPASRTSAPRCGIY